MIASLAGHLPAPPPIVLAQQVLAPAAYDAVRADLRALVESFDAGDGEVRIVAEYLLVVGLKL
jgi:hypothetical protein